jgi:uncharacterized integral membrane protein
MRIFLNTCGIVLILLSLVYFATQNNQVITITYHTGFSDTYPLWAVVIFPFFIGIITGNLLDVVKRFRLSREIRKLRRTLRATGQPADR